MISTFRTRASNENVKSVVAVSALLAMERSRFPPLIRFVISAFGTRASNENVKSVVAVSAFFAII